MIVTNVGALPDLVPPDIGIVCETGIQFIASAMNQMLNFDLVTFQTAIKKEKKKLDWNVFSKAILHFNFDY
jgi:hypothetical protein